jgi:hypothetical protein
MKQLRRNFMEWTNPKSALITGGSSGMGAAFARELAKQGLKIILVARREKRLKKLAQELESENNRQMEVLVADLANEEDRKKVVNRIAEKDDIEVLINNAGFGVRGAFHKNPIDKNLNMMLVHNTAPVEFSRAVIPGMIERKRGVIINMSSLISLLEKNQGGIYSASKAFLNVFSKSLAIELEGTGIKIQALCPGMTITEFHSVGDYEGYDRSKIPEVAWMTAEETVKESLRALRKKKVVVIPGRKNRLIAWAWNRPLLGKILRKRVKL